MSAPLVRSASTKRSIRDAVNWRLTATVLAVACFPLLFVLGALASRTPANVGLDATWHANRQVWVVSKVGPVSSAQDSGFKVGDVITSADGAPVLSLTDGGAAQIERAEIIAVTRPSTSTNYVADATLRSPNWAVVLFFSVSFFLIGIIALWRGHDAAPLALALTCISGASELAILPGVYRQESWALPIHSFLIPLFFASFAHLFVMFPIRRHLRIRKWTIPVWLIPASSIPVGLLSFYASVIRPELYPTFRLVAFPYLLGCLFAGIASLILGWRQTTNPRVKAQIRIVLGGSLIAIIPFLLLSAVPEAAVNTDLVSPKFTLLSLVLMPLSFGYAILRYQIMDLQLYIRRGIVYSLLALAVTGIYALILFVGTTLIQHQVGINDAFVLAVSGTIVAIIFQRLRDDLQSRVDRAFDRSHYDYRTQLLEFSRRMTEQLEGEDLGTLTATLISQTLEPTYVRMYMFDPEGQTFRLKSGVGVPPQDAATEFSARHPLVAGLREEGGLRQNFDAAIDQTALSILLQKEQDVVGLLILGRKKADLPYSSDDLSLLKTVANQLAVAADNSRLYERTRDLYLSSIRTLAATVDAKDPYTHGHSARVAAYSRSIAAALNLDREEVEAIELAGLLHDIGKIGIPDSVLQKPGRLDPDERVLIMEHAALGAKIISENPSLMPLAPFVRHHHEWFDGGGYPDGLEGTEIPLGAAIISVADTFDTMTTDRPYRAAPGRDKALAELQRCSGTQFHPDVVSSFLKVQGFASEPTQQPEVAHLSYTAAGRISTVDTRAMRIVYRVVQMIGEVTELDSFIARVVDLIQRELGTGTVDIYLTDHVTADLVSQTAPSEESAVKETRVENGKGLVGWVAEHRVPARIENTQHDSRGAQGRHPKTRAHLAVPLVIDNQTIGVIDVQGRRTGSFTADDETLLVIVAQQLAQVVEVAQLHDQLKKSAILDGLTGVANHRYFYQRLEEELARSARTQSDVTLLLIDVDGLKQLNDTHGHIAGDAALRALAMLIERESRSTDVVARYGGDEFAVILPDVNEPGAIHYANRILDVISASSFDLHGECVPLPSISWGMASLANDGGRAVELVAAADERMYRHKFDATKPQPRSIAASGRG